MLDSQHPITPEQLHILGQLVSWHDWCKSAKNAEPAMCYADSNHIYPSNGRDNVFLSVGKAALDNAPQELVDELYKAAAFWDSLDEANLVFNTLKSATKASTFLIDASADSQGHSLYPYKDAATTQKAAQQFYDDRAKLPLILREQGADKLLKSAEFPNLPILIQRFCKAAHGDLTGSYKHACAMVHERTPRKHVPNEVKKLAMIIDGLADLPPGWVKTATQSFAAFDEMTGFDSRYLWNTDVPELQILDDFEYLTKSAHTKTTDWELLASFAPEVLAKTGFDEDRLQDVLKTLPYSDQSIIKTFQT